LPAATVAVLGYVSLRQWQRSAELLSREQARDVATMAADKVDMVLRAVEDDALARLQAALAGGRALEAALDDFVAATPIVERLYVLDREGRVVYPRVPGGADAPVIAALRADVRLLVLCAILGLTSWTGLARLLRGESLKLSQLEYIQAAHAFGVRDSRVLTRHILPNVAHIVIIATVMDFSGFVLYEAVLSYVGVGVDPATTSFGTMINAARLEMGREPIVWWSLAAAFTFMFALVLAANLFADAARDGFDPRVRV